MWKYFNSCTCWSTIFYKKPTAPIARNFTSSLSFINTFFKQFNSISINALHPHVSLECRQHLKGTAQLDVEGKFQWDWGEVRRGTLGHRQAECVRVCVCADPVTIKLRPPVCENNWNFQCWKEHDMLCSLLSAAEEDNREQTGTSDTETVLCSYMCATVIRVKTGAI